MKPDERYAKGIELICRETGADENTAYAMLLLTATLMDLCPWDIEVAYIVISDCKGSKHVDLCKSEPGQG